MSRTRTLTNLILDVRQRTNMENSTFVTDAELTEYLNQELAELHARITANEGQPHFRTAAAPFTTTVGTALYGLPSDFWRMQEVTCTFDGVTRPMEPFMPLERASLLNSQLIYPYTTTPRYRVQADNLEILPTSRAVTVSLFYIARSPRLASGSDTVEGFDGYEIAAVYGACASVQQKEETDPSFYLGQKDRIYRLVDVHAGNRDGSHPERVVDVVGTDDLYPLSSYWR